jgi:hypothetical protein
MPSSDKCFPRSRQFDHAYVDDDWTDRLSLAVSAPPMLD